MLRINTDKSILDFDFQELQSCFDLEIALVEFDERPLRILLCLRNHLFHDFRKPSLLDLVDSLVSEQHPE